jgi:Flp pilus assembly protein TadG
MSLARARRDDGAAAVEFALISVLLLTLIFGIIQYSYYFFQSQGASSSVREAARLAAVGVNNCSTFKSTVVSRASSNGITVSAANVSLTFTGAGSRPAIGDLATVSLTYTPAKFGFPFVPFISGTDTKSALTRVEALGDLASMTC